MSGRKLIRPASPISSPYARPVMMEGLENRRLMSGGGGGGFGHGHGSGDHGFGSNLGSTIAFSEAPSAVQTGLTDLATTDGVTAPTTDQTLYLSNSNGVESYTLISSGTGTVSRLTVDQNGDPVTAPTRTTTTFGAVGNSAVTDEITAIATALSVTAPTDATSVTVVTAADGTITYSVRLSDSTSSNFRHHGTEITVDANGVPVGNQRIPLSTLPTAIQTGLTDNAPAGSTALTDASLISVRTINGVTTYTAVYTTTGTTTAVTVDATGALADLPSRSTVTFADLDSGVAAALQSLATADGVTDAIPTTQTVTAYDEANGTTVYSVRLALTTTDTNGNTYTRYVTESVDQDGNPTVPPSGGGFGGDDFFFAGGCIGLTDPTTTTTTTTTSSTTPSITAASVVSNVATAISTGPVVASVRGGFTLFGRRF